MLAAFYQTLCYPELLGKNIVIPDTSSEALYLSERGELFCYTGIYSRDKSRVLFESWPYYLSGKHTGDCRKDIRGFFQIKNGCILLTGFVDQGLFNETRYKQLRHHVVRMPAVNTNYFGIERRVETKDAWGFEENGELSRSCFGLTHSELEYLVRVYAERLGVCNDYVQQLRITRSMTGDNFCDLTGLWIPPRFPYVAFSNGYSFSHVSLYGFYRHVGLMLSLIPDNVASRMSECKTLGGEIIDRVRRIDDYLPSAIKVTREYVFPEMYVE